MKINPTFRRVGVWTLLLLSAVWCSPAAAEEDDGLRSACPGPECGPCSYDNDPAVTPPRCPWYVRMDGIALRRDAKGNMNAASLNAIGTGVAVDNIVLSTRSLDAPFQAGPHILIGHSLSDVYQIEFSFFDLSQSDSSAEVRDAAGRLYSPFTPLGAAATQYDNNTAAFLTYSTYLNNYEFNLRQHVTMPQGRMSVSYLFGFRGMNLNEKLGYHVEPTLGGTRAGSTANVYATNEMYGAQIGMLSEFYIDHGWWVNFEMKGAVMADSSRVTTECLGQDLVTPFTTTRSGTAFVGDLSLDLVQRWNDRLSTRIGYRAMWLEHVALASDNFNTNIDMFLHGPAQVNNRGGAVYHGPEAGLEFSW